MEKREGEARDVYAELGVKKVINAAGTYTMVGGSRMSERTLAAMASAARSHVVLKDLQTRVHERLAVITKNEAAYVTNGAACALHITGAAAIARRWGRPHASLTPEQTAKCEIVIHRAHRNPYDHALRLLGVKLVEIGYPNSILPTTAKDLELAITENTVAVYYFFMPPGGWISSGALDFRQTVETAKKYGVPVVVDAAAQVPPVENLWNITGQGASACIFSGGKDLRGPQASGLVVGCREFMERVEATAFPTYGVGRMFKVGREEIVGLWSAVEEYVAMDHDARASWAEERIAALDRAFRGSRNVSVQRVYPNEAGQPMPQAIVRFRGFSGLSGTVSAHVLRRFADGDPSIFSVAAGEDGVFINPMTLRDGEFDAITQRVGEIEKEIEMKGECAQR
ncbi:MAG: aminotransferase class V-fold PLP-dependent enzyme [Synergistaceae bacterium]|jgi:L-seryl-tRNA(Ser) seleniumtransferase|nr:aminotransferase class V-fold PLP-dependent enzyme [Synergistaceae bacterium]